MTTKVFEHGSEQKNEGKVWKFQKNSYLKEFESTVISCKPWTMDINQKRKKTKKSKKKQELYEIKLKDSILFAEGGGQPSDIGTINDVPVLRVVRTENSDIIHQTTKPIDIGTNVNIKLNWKTRFDHMQHHSSQHLISAIFRNKLNMNTLSWWLSEYPKPCQIEFECKEPNKITDKLINSMEVDINQIIINGNDMDVHIFHDNNSINEFERNNNGFKLKELPKGYGVLRCIEIKDIEYNICCGTHVSNTNQLQMIKFCGYNINKNEGKMILYFLTGNRIFNQFSDIFNRQKEMNNILKTNPENHIKNITKIQNDCKHANLLVKILEKRLIQLEIERIKAKNEPVLYEHFINGSANVLQKIINALVNGNNDVFIMFSYGKSDKTGKYIIGTNQKDFLKKNKNVILQYIDARGGGKPGTLQGNANNLRGYKDLLTFVKENMFNDINESVNDDVKVDDIKSDDNDVELTKNGSNLCSKIDKLLNDINNI